MISDKKTAEFVHALLREYGKRLDESIALVDRECSPDEAKEYRSAVAKILGYSFHYLMERLYELHPDLEPDALRSQRGGG